MAALVPTGCSDGPGREDLGFLAVATSACDRLVECGCLSVEEAEECRLDFGGAFFGIEGLVYDDACAQSWQRWVRSASCTDLVLPELADVCPIYHGATYEGFPCEDAGMFATSCGPQLWCVGGTCIDPAGQSFGGPDELCDPLTGCKGGLACGELGRCMPPPGPGQPCADGRCADGARCESQDFDGAPVCVAGGEVGSPCTGHVQCASFNCPAGFCAPAAAVGAPCSTTLPCGPEASCADGVCQGAAAGFCGVFTVVESSR